MFEFEFLNERVIGGHSHADFEMFFVLDGEVNFRVDDDEFILKESDFIVVNAGQEHYYRAIGEILIASIHISRSELKKLLNQNNIIFYCNSTMGNRGRYDDICNVLKRICSYHYSDESRGEVYLMSMYYQLLDLLVSKFQLTERDKEYSNLVHKNEERKQEISDYINDNYESKISLNDLAAKLFLSRAYLSKYIKRQFGLSFLDYVNNVRIEHAISDLIYSDKPVVRIAMDTGFASSAAFNKAFKEKYNMTPSVYRGQWKEIDKKSSYTKNNQQNIENKLNEFFKERNETEDLEHLVINNVNIEKDEYLCEVNDKSSLINAGTAADLLHSDMQEHMLKLKKKLGFKYVRFWDLYSPEMFLDEHSENKKYNFNKLDRVLDFIINNEMIPYIEMGVKTKKLIKKYKVMLVGNDVENMFETREIWRHFVEEFSRHIINRYGVAEVGKWYFEYWRMEKDNNIATSNDPNLNMENIEKYFGDFDILASVMRKILPGIKVGGNGLSTRYGKGSLRETLDKWNKHEEKPSFLTVYCYPYKMSKNDKSSKADISIDSEFLMNYVKSVTEIVEETQMNVDEIHISEWSLTVSNRNQLNDSCIKGAYVLKNLIDVYNSKISLIGYWTGSDLFADFYDSNEFLNGGSGLMTKDGIAKPAYYAFKFLHHLKGRVIKTGDNYIVADEGHGSYRIACHNYKQFNYQYCLSEEDEMDFTKFDELLVDKDVKRMSFKLQVENDGKYQVKVSSVSNFNGSIQDEWMRMGKPTDMTVENIEYLTRICVPRMQVSYKEAVDGILEFETNLDANEIQLLKITYEY